MIKILARHRIFSYILFTLCFTLILSPIVYASTGGAIDRGQTFALVLLGLITLSLFIYLFVVIFQPERF